MQGIGARELRARLCAKEKLLLLDVRPAAHFAVTRLRGAVNWPLREITRQSPGGLREQLAQLAEREEELVVCVCRRGNDSLVATRLLRQVGIEAMNLRHGLQELLSWRDGHVLT